MNLFEEAAAFMAKHPQSENTNDFLQTSDSCEKFLRELKMMYENATTREIEKVLEAVRSQLTPPYDKAQVLKLLRPKLED